MQNVYKILIRKPQRKRLLRRPMHRWEDNIRMYLSERGWEGIDWMQWLRTGTSAKQALVNVIMNLHVS